MSHTPGPWIVMEDPGEKCEECGREHVGRFLVSAQPGPLGIAVVCAYGDQEREEANAYLIKAAPALLAACKRAKGFIDSWGKKLGDWDQVDQNTINAVNAALAEARGQ